MVPREPGDFPNEDEIYKRLEEFDQQFIAKSTNLDQNQYNESGNAKALSDIIDKILKEQRDSSGLMNLEAEH